MIAILFALQAAAQSPAVSDLASPDRVFPVDFTQIRGARELPDGRVIVSDRLDKGVVVVDFTRGSITPIGRTGSGPAEYRLPTVLSAMPGDSTLLSDEGNQRLAVIGPDLKIHRSFNLMLPGFGVGLGARTIDQRGRYYLSIPDWANGPRAGLPGDTIVVVRYDARTQKVDTLARIKGSTPRKNTMRPGMGSVMFAAQDAWTATLDGRVAIVRSADYRVEWRDAEGRVTLGKPIPFDRRPVTLEDRVDFTRRFLRSTSISGKGMDGGLSPLPAEMMTEARVREMASYHEHADVHPPFVPGAPLLSPGGTLWVEKSVRLNLPQTWDVIGVDGHLVSRIQMPRGRRLVALGARWIYVVQTDEDGLQHLERYTYPGKS